MRIVSIIIGLLLITSVAFAQPVFEEKSVISETVIDEEGRISITEKTRVYKDGKVISERITDRQVFAPDFNLEQITSDKVISLYNEISYIADVVWTEEVINAYRAKTIR